MTIDEWIESASSRLEQAGFSTPRLDVELIIAHTIRKPRTYLHAHGDEDLEKQHEDIAFARLDLRLAHTPIAYITGHKEFYRRQFKTTPAALIPRPETEAFFPVLREVMTTVVSRNQRTPRLVDVGTGTGCIGITAKLEWPELKVTLIDNSQHALNLAKKNAELLNANVQFIRNDLLRGYGSPIDIVVANLPYVGHSWEVSPETAAEPESALFATENGLSLIFQLIDQSNMLLKPGSFLLLESDVRQHSAIIAKATDSGFEHAKTNELVTCFVRKLD